MCKNCITRYQKDVDFIEDLQRVIEVHDDSDYAKEIKKQLKHVKPQAELMLNLNKASHERDAGTDEIEQIIGQFMEDHPKVARKALKQHLRGDFNPVGDLVKTYLD